MQKIRVLIVDDAVVIRRMLSDALAADPEIEVVGVAANGQMALSKIAELKPDIVTLDLEMPDMDGIETLTELRKVWPQLPVIVFSTLSERGAASTLEALSRGANDSVTKPANIGSVKAAQERVREDLTPKIKGLVGRRLTKVLPFISRAIPPVVPQIVPLNRTMPPAQVVVIGVSTGGPNILGAVLERLPAFLPAPVLIVQHMPPIFTRLLADRLDRTCALPVREAMHGEVAHSGGVWIARGGHHLFLNGTPAQLTMELNEAAAENSCRPAADVLFRSAARICGRRTLGVVLTGMGHDGLRGAEEIHAVGGRIFVQDEASSTVWGMPGSVARAGFAERILPIQQIGDAIIEAVMGSRPATRELCHGH